MPTYELTCSDCDERFERFLTRLLKSEDKVCPACGSTEVSQGVGGGYRPPARRSADPVCVPRSGFG